MLNVALITDQLPPYRIKQFNFYNSIKDVKLDVFYTLPKSNWRPWPAVDYINKNFSEYNIKDLDLKKYRLLMVGGWKWLLSNITPILLERKIRNLKIVLIDDGVYPSYFGEKHFILLKKFLTNFVDAFLINGRIAKMFYTGILKVDIKRCFNQYMTVDTDKILSLYTIKNEIRKSEKEKWNIHEKSIVLTYVGRLVKRKNVELIIETVKYLKSETNTDFHVLIIGDGLYRKTLLNVAKKYRVDITITGYAKNILDIFKLYYVGDIFILPSIKEPWGLVINEAMSAGLPIIANFDIGSVHDLVFNNINGYILEFLDPIELKKNIIKLLDNDERQNMGKMSFEIIKNWNYLKAKKSFFELLNFIF